MFENFLKGLKKHRKDILKTEPHETILRASGRTYKDREKLSQAISEEFAREAREAAKK